MFTGCFYNALRFPDVIRMLFTLSCIGNSSNIVSVFSKTSRCLNCKHRAISAVSPKLRGYVRNGNNTLYRLMHCVLIQIQLFHLPYRMVLSREGTRGEHHGTSDLGPFLGSQLGSQQKFDERERERECCTRSTTRNEFP